MNGSYCIDCKVWFPRDFDEDWKPRCASCWQKHKTDRDSRWRPNFCDDEPRSRYWGDEAKSRRDRQPPPPLSSAPDPEFNQFLPALIQIAHPDRCEHPQANAITAWLLAERKKQKGAQ